MVWHYLCVRVLYPVWQKEIFLCDKRISNKCQKQSIIIERRRRRRKKTLVHQAREYIPVDWLLVVMSTVWWHNPFSYLLRHFFGTRFYTWKYNYTTTDGRAWNFVDNFSIKLVNWSFDWISRIFCVLQQNINNKQTIKQNFNLTQTHKHYRSNRKLQCVLHVLYNINSMSMVDGYILCGKQQPTLNVGIISLHVCGRYTPYSYRHMNVLIY